MFLKIFHRHSPLTQCHYQSLPSTVLSFIHVCMYESIENFVALLSRCVVDVLYFYIVIYWSLFILTLAHYHLFIYYHTLVIIYSQFRFIYEFPFCFTALFFCVCFSISTKLISNHDKYKYV